MLSKRTISAITAVCFTIIGILPIPVFAVSAEAVSTSASQDGVIKINSSSAASGKIASMVTNSGISLTTGAALSIMDTASDTVVDLADSTISSKNPFTAIIVDVFNLTLIADTTIDAAFPGDGDEAGKKQDIPATAGVLAMPEPKEDESLWYSSRIPMKKEHQKLLWDYCQERKLDYIDMLALISLESNFYEKCSSGKHKGYFQISSAHGPNLSKTLKTPNKPLDGAININWGTAMYSWILVDKRVKDLKGKQQRDAALSIYQRGCGGYDRYGLSRSFLAKYYKKRDIVVSYFKQAE